MALSIICLWHKNFLSAKKGSNGHGVVDFHETTTVSQPDLVLSKPLTTNELENPWSGWPSYITRYKKMWNHLPKQSSYVKFNHCLNCSIILLIVICVHKYIYTLHICSLYIKIMHSTLYIYIYIWSSSQPFPTQFPHNFSPSKTIDYQVHLLPHCSEDQRRSTWGQKNGERCPG